MYKASIIVSLSNEYALTENFFGNLLGIINGDIDVFAVVDGETDRKTIQFLDKLKNMYPNISVIYNKLDIENPIIRINTAFKGCSSLEKISVLPRIYHN